MTRQKDHWKETPSLSQYFQKLHSVHAGHLHVNEQATVFIEFAAG